MGGMKLPGGKKLIVPSDGSTRGVLRSHQVSKFGESCEATRSRPVPLARRSLSVARRSLSAAFSAVLGATNWKKVTTPAPLAHSFLEHVAPCAA